MEAPMSFKHFELVANHSQTKGPDRAVVLILAVRADKKTGESWPSLNRIAKDAGLNRRTVSRCLRAIQRTGELLIVHHGHAARTRGGIQESNRYRITIDPPQGRGGESLPLPDKVGAESPEGRGGESHKVGAHSPKGRGGLPPKPSENSQSEPSRNRQGKKPTGLPDYRIDYETAKIPEINCYEDIYGCQDPILAAMAITRERDIKGWGYWVKVLNQGRKEYGPERADRLFRGCLAKLFGELKAGEKGNPGALLNEKLKDVFR